MIQELVVPQNIFYLQLLLFQSDGVLTVSLLFDDVTCRNQLRAIEANHSIKGYCVYSSTLIAAIHHIKQTMVTLRKFVGYCVHLRKEIVALAF